MLGPLLQEPSPMVPVERGPFKIGKNIPIQVEYKFSGLWSWRGENLEKTYVETQPFPHDTKGSKR